MSWIARGGNVNKSKFSVTREMDGAETIEKWTPTREYLRGKQITIERFEQWAACNHILLEDLDKRATNPNQKKADYIARFPDSTEIVIEVKEITRPIRVRHLKQEGPCFDFEGKTSTRGAFAAAGPVRKKIKEARSQLKESADKSVPTLFLIGHWAPFPLWAEQFDIDFLRLVIPIAIRGGGPAFALPVLGLQLVSVARGGRQAAGKDNRSISAIGRFDGNSDHLVLYPHQNAKVPFKTPLPGIKHFRG